VHVQTSFEAASVIPTLSTQRLTDDAARCWGFYASDCCVWENHIGGSLAGKRNEAASLGIRQVAEVRDELRRCIWVVGQFEFAPFLPQENAGMAHQKL